jgi:hypothetical protein
MSQDWGMALVGHGMSQDLEQLAKWGVNVPEGVCYVYNLHFLAASTGVE